MTADSTDHEFEVPLDCDLEGHEWHTVEVVAAREGAFVERVCARCGTTAMVGPDELGGWV